MMIDIHCHILPGIDDGAAHDLAAMDMAKHAVAQGITHIVATPHHRHPKYNNTKQDIEGYVNQLNRLLEKNAINLKVLPGQETRIFGEMDEAIKENELLPLNNSRYLFVEFPSDHVPGYTHQLFYELMLLDIIPVVVHPERNSDIMQHPDLLYKIVQKGGLTQVTAASVVGKFGKKIQRFTEQILEANLTHFVASDAHNITTRSFHLREAYELIEKDFGQDMRFALQDNAELLIDNMMVNRMEPSHIKTKKFLGLF